MEGVQKVTGSAWTGLGGTGDIQRVLEMFEGHKQLEGNSQRVVRGLGESLEV